LIIPKTRNKDRLKRHRRIRKKLFGTAERPRLCVFRSLRNIYAQVIDDTTGNTLVSASSLEKELEEQIASLKGKKEVAKFIGSLIAKRAIENDIKTVVFDRGGYKYHGRISSLATGAREEGLIF